MKTSKSLLLGLLMLVLFNVGYAQNKIPENITVFTPEEMNMMWKKFSSDKSWQVLQKEVDTKNFYRIANKEAAWGFKGTITDEKGVKSEVLFCVYDFLNPKNEKQGCSMVWSKVGEKSYKAYLVFPEGVTDLDKKFEASEEWYVDASNKIQKANSWGKCFRKCVQRGVPVPGVETEIGKDKSKIKVGDATLTVSCPGLCFASALSCSTLAAGTAIAIIGAGVATASTGGITLPVLIAAGGFGAAVLFTCTATGCGSCIFLCALGCVGE
ncbi:hypothetical protein [Xanthocytophaga agilis]|uniref:Uncharacterized protein n=1 Tax=Xanthocytophaga agilis TaxID=3048010 RepID=A0AAE3UEH5_9BACT|nr:hypothetical protein [Xanthocytophaga agilis]MDJ1500267.1 hypothetical protein [Xanthocytophaga agilis]